jgi:hypothetical protein
MASASLNLNIAMRAGLQPSKTQSYGKEEVPTFYTSQKNKNIMYVSVELQKTYFLTVTVAPQEAMSPPHLFYIAALVPLSVASFIPV